MVQTQYFSDIYQDFPPSPFATEFWEFYKVIWEAERRFNLVFRRDHNVAVWTANRVRFYYSIAEQLGLYRAPAPSNSESRPVTLEEEFPRIEPIDHIIQTGANGPATELRKRPRGCVYTQDYVNRFLDSGRRVLLIHGAPEELDPHPLLQSISFEDFNLRVRQNMLRRKSKRVELDQSSHDFWGSVAAFFESQLGIELFNSDEIQTRIQRHRRRYQAEHMFFEPLRAKTLICMAHYFRAPTIEAAKAAKLWTIDYQHGINSRYHLGYGYPNVRPEQRTIPYMPDEFWSWGKLWADPKWFPTECCAPRYLGHNQAFNGEPADVPYDRRPENVLLIATSWAMQAEFKKIAAELAGRYPSWIIRLKLHPRENTQEYQDLLPNNANLEIIPGDVDIRFASSQVRYVLSVCSSSLFDVLLEDCRIAVLNSPAVEYAEDFAIRYGLPMLEGDASNFEDVLSALEQQSIPIDEVFHTASDEEWETMDESLATPNNSEWFRTLEDKEIEQSYLARKLSKRFRKRFHLNVDPKMLLLPKTGGPFQRYEAKLFRQYKQKSYNEIARTSLQEFRDMKDRVAAIEELIRTGIEPARHSAAIRDLVKDALETNNWPAIRRITSAVFSDSSDSGRVLRAELFEVCVTSHQGAADASSKLNAPNWHDAVKLLQELSPVTRRLADSYNRYASASLRTYADTQVSRDEQLELQSELGSRIRSGDNFTLMRVSDGEVYAFEPEWVPREIIKADQMLRETLWWGETIPCDLKKSLQRQTVLGIANSDYLGIPSAYRLLHDFSETLLKMRGPIETWTAVARAHRILFDRLDRMVADGQLNWSEKVLLDDQCYQELFARDRLPSYAAKDRQAVLVSCFTKDQVNAALGDDFFDLDVRLPPQVNVRHLVSDDKFAATATPFVLDDLLDQVDRLATDGAVFYVAGGIVGKVLINRIAELGATALDIGAAPDYWMGATARSPQNFMDHNRPKR